MLSHAHRPTILGIRGILPLIVPRAAFFFLWIPDNLFCGDIGFLNLHAWFHVCGAIAPWWFINWWVLDISQWAHVRRVQAGGSGCELQESRRL